MEKDIIRQYIDSSAEACKSGDGKAALKYADMALKAEPENPYAWIAKMKSIEHIGSQTDLKTVEVIEAGKNALKYAPEDKKDEITKELCAYKLARALSLLKSATEQMRDTAKIKSTYRHFFTSDFLIASSKTNQVDNRAIFAIDDLADGALMLLASIPDEALTLDGKLAQLVGECALEYRRESDALSERFEIYGAVITNEAAEIRNERVREMEDRSKKALKIIEEREARELKARQDLFWAENKELKQRILSERERLSDQADDLNAQIESLPEMSAVRKIEEEISKLKNAREALGIFKGKKKKIISSEIDGLEGKLSEARGALDEAALPIREQAAGLKARILKIDDEFTKDRPQYCSTKGGRP